MKVADRLLAGCPGNGTDVSILVLLDEGCRQRDMALEIAALKEFQSLFSWMKVADKLGGRFRRQSREVSILVLLDEGCRLDPDCVGRQGIDPFQSLFSWMKVADTWQLGWHVTGPVFQSLFSWMKVADVCTRKTQRPI